jgi:8-oxo-dGTP diphosphatase
MESGVAAQTDRVDAVNKRGAAPDADVIDARLRAAGGVVRRDATEGAEVVLVHRPRFDDWSLPKGKLKKGEHPLAGAVREVREETGIHGLVGPRLPTVQYDVWSRDSLVEKFVDYWAMVVADDDRGLFTPGREVDDIAWLPVSQALDRLSYPHDKRVLRAYAELPMVHRPVVLIRHASAGERGSWPGPDEARPLDESGKHQAEYLAALLPHFGPTRLVSAEPVRCVETLAPLAAAMRLSIDVDARFNESARPDAAAEALRSSANPDGTLVVCSQGGLIPGAISTLNGGAPARYRVSKGDGWVLSFAEASLATLDAFTLNA